jgi:hypothetical protein
MTHFSVIGPSSCWPFTRISCMIGLKHKLMIRWFYTLGFVTDFVGSRPDLDKKTRTFRHNNVSIPANSYSNNIPA